jgi:5-methylcytosine-specific restriction endonuclease McrA
MPKLSCLDCGIPTAKSRCDTCQEVREASQPKRERPSSSMRGYDANWNRVRVVVLRRDNWTCVRCNKKLVGSDATVDHRVPLARGGSNDLSNLQSMCRSCNSSKKDR